MRQCSRITSAVVAAAVLAAVASCGQAPAPAAAPPTNPLHGAWSVVSLTESGAAAIDPAQPGLFVFTERHYSSVYSLGSEPRPMAATPFVPTADEKTAQYDTIIVNSGTYDVDGSSITFRPMVARSPEFIGGQAVMDFEIDGDTLTLTTRSLTGADGTPAPGAAGSSMRLRRVE